ncbi:MAG: DNA-binding response regulator [Firmicutes bacterium HGW-Firmicutes-20]|nr:response regulator transcription factor [Erysipelotrichaceae bacterium]PKM63868.1 MAG: DNA-binding response regulator [Firmicutes bacterium HGW-Firmicutes-20]PKM87543.1 MAG: DNA-binding response regulator [Firmicutes bacterium HGW-Firmicutes-10]
MARILLVEDEESIRKLIAYDLKSAKHEVVLCSKGDEAKFVGLNESFDCMIIDWMLPGMSGLELVRLFRKNNKQSIMIMLTAKDDEGDILEAFEAGVDDYVTKPFSPRELLARINAHLKRNTVKSDTMLAYEDIRLDMTRREAFIVDRLIELTKKEFDLLEYLLRNRRIVLSRDDILNEIWNFDYDGDTRIVDVHIFKLRLKLKGSLLTIRSIRGVGYVLEKKDE